jgi:aryl-alcohol dehydrogenase-like predicted oxidoreductase
MCNGSSRAFNRSLHTTDDGFGVDSNLGGHMKNLVLGTAQFGLDYGINNKAGKVCPDEVRRILARAFGEGVDCLDTANAYGDSEKTLGRVIEDLRLPFRIVAKLSVDNSEPSEVFANTLNDLRMKKIYGCLIHQFDQFKQNPDIWAYLLDLKKRGIIQKYGFSLYAPDELELLFENNVRFDIVQIPYNVFDRRFEPYLPDLHKRGIEVYARSIFLQGLFFKDVESLSSHFDTVKDMLRRLHSLCLNNNLAIEDVCLNFAYLNPLISQTLIGVDSVLNLSGNIRSLGKAQEYKKIAADLQYLSVVDENILLPYRWR